MADFCIIETICITFVGEYTWPVFVFPDHSVPTKFLLTRPSPTALPVLLLRRHSLQWRAKEELSEFVPSDHYNEGNEDGPMKTPDEIERAEAFREALEFNGMDHYYKLIMEKEKKIREMQGLFVEDDDEDSDDDRAFVGSNAKKRMFSAVLNGRGRAKGKGRASTIPTPSPTPRKSLKLSSMPFNINMYDRDEDDDEDLPHPSTLTPSKRPTLTPASGSKAGAKANYDYVTRKQIEMLTTKKKDAKQTQLAQKEAEEAKGPTKDPSKVNIYINREENPFILDKKIVEKHPRLANQITGDITDGFEIRNSKDFKTIAPELFESLAEWLNTGDYKPILVEPAGDQSPYLKGAKSQDHYEKSAEKASLLWKIAHQLGLEDLQKLIHRKILAQSPLEPNSLLNLTRMVHWNPATGTEIDNAMRQMLKEDLCRRHYYILENNALRLARIFKQNAGLAREVYKWLSENLEDEVVDEAQKARDEAGSETEEEFEFEY